MHFSAYFRVSRCGRRAARRAGELGLHAEKATSRDSVRRTAAEGTPRARNRAAPNVS